MITVPYERTVFYYETDKMGCVHHSNYLHWFEEARAHFMRVRDFCYEGMEESGIMSPVLTAELQYRSMSRFGDTVVVTTAIESYSGARIIFTYKITDRETGELRCEGKTSHCFLNEKGRPVSLKKAMPEYDSAVRACLTEE